MKKCFLFGLGNPGGEFNNTRHNLGADMLCFWIETIRGQGAFISDWKTQEKFHARICEGEYNGVAVVAVSPLVFMNDSGKVLAAYMRYHPQDREQILVIHDDLELPLGETKYQATGSAHGHNGMRSIHQCIGDSNIPQLRIGIGRPSQEVPVDRFVLSTFTSEEKKVLQEKESEILEAISNFVFLPLG